MKILKMEGLPNTTFVETEKKYDNKKVYAAYMFIDDQEYKTFQGHFYKVKNYVLNGNKKGKAEKYVGMKMELVPFGMAH